jgi:hypothetical protein
MPLDKTQSSRALLMCLSATLVSGCAALSIENAAQLSSYDLCYVLMSGKYSAPSKAAASQELASRQNSCQAEAPVIAARIQGEAAQSAAALAYSAQLLTPRAAAVPTQPAGTLKGSYVSGFNRVCVYSTISGDKALTVQSTAVCPLSY